MIDNAFLSSYDLPLGAYRAGALALLAAIVTAPSTASASERQAHGTGGAYVAMSAGAAYPTGSTPITGTLGTGAIGIPFTGTSKYKTGWSGRVAFGYEENVKSAAQGDGEDGRAPRYRVELEGLLLRLNRGTYSAGLLNVEPQGDFEAQALFVNGMYRLIGKQSARLWTGAGVGYARVSVPNSRQLVNCACLGAARGNGVTYQGKLAGDLRISTNANLFVEAAFVRLPTLSTAERPIPVGSYDRTSVINTSAGIRFYF